MTMRKMQIAGRVGQSPDFDTYDGTPVANLSVATERYRDDDTVWVSVTVWGAKAEFVRDYIDKGDAVVAHGAPDVDAWEGRDGVNAELTLNADGLEPVGSNGGGQQGGQPPPAEPRGDFGGEPGPAGGGEEGEPFDDEEVPF